MFRQREEAGDWGLQAGRVPEDGGGLIIHIRDVEPDIHHRKPSCDRCLHIRKGFDGHMMDYLHQSLMSPQTSFQQTWQDKYNSNRCKININVCKRARSMCARSANMQDDKWPYPHPSWPDNVYVPSCKAGLSMFNYFRFCSPFWLPLALQWMINKPL